MEIGLVRHFRVRLALPAKRLVAMDEVVRWFDAYDAAPIESGAADLGGVAWERCVASDLPRAYGTAEAIFPGAVERRAELREIPLSLPRTRIKLPFAWWAVCARLSYSFDAEARAELRRAEERVGALFDELLAGPERRILIVSHGALMMLMRAELARRGFRGPRIVYPRNGKLYRFAR